MLRQKFMYTQEMNSEFERISEGALSVAALYNTIYKPKAAESIVESSKVVSDDNRIRVYFSITEEGRKQLDIMTNEYRAVLSDIEKAFGAPKALARIYLDTLDESEVAKFTRKKRIKAFLCIAVPVVIIGLLCLKIFLFSGNVVDVDFEGKTTIIIYESQEESDSFMKKSIRTISAIFIVILSLTMSGFTYAADAAQVTQTEIILFSDDLQIIVETIEYQVSASGAIS